MKYLVAVSGGVDSVVLLDMLARTKHHLVIAHVDHGIRGEESAADERFVAGLAKQYQLPYVSTQLELGASASEEQAREGRYAFLLTQAKKFGAQVVTAHHADDAVETIALNLVRGTGWRGLAVMDRTEVARPLLAVHKAQLYDYALKHGLEWVEDATNRSDKYTRNRLRARLAGAKVDEVALLALRASQLQLRREITREVDRLCQKYTNSRHALIAIDQEVAIELLGAVIKHVAGVRPTRPQLVRALLAIKTAKRGTVFQLGGGIVLHFTIRNYTVSVV